MLISKYTPQHKTLLPVDLGRLWSDFAPIVCKQRPPNLNETVEKPSGLAGTKWVVEKGHTGIQPGIQKTKKKAILVP